MKKTMITGYAFIFILQVFTGLTLAVSIDSIPALQFGFGDMTCPAVISPDGKYFLTGSNDARARLWDAETGALLRTFTGHNARISALAFSPDGKFILTATQDNDSKAIWKNTDDNSVRLWNTKTGECLGIFLKGYFLGFNDVSFSPDGLTIGAATDYGHAVLYDLSGDSTRCDLRLGSEDINAITFSSDSTSFLTGSSDSIVYLVDAASCESYWKINIGDGYIKSVAFSSDASMFLTTSYDARVRLYNTEEKKLLRQFSGFYSTVGSAVFSSDTRSVLSCGRYGRYEKSIVAALLWDIASGDTIRTFRGHTSDILSALFLPGEQTIMTSSSDNTVRFWNTSSGSCLKTFNVGTKPVDAFDISPDGSILASAHGGEKELFLWDVNSALPLRSFKGHTASIQAVSYSPDGATILTGSYDSTARLWDTKTGECIRVFKGHTWSVMDVEISPDGKHCVTVSSDKTAKLWNISSGECIRTFTGHTATIRTVAFSHDGSTIATAGYQDSIHLWNTATGACIKKIKELDKNIVSIAFSPDDSKILTGTFSDTAHLWNVATGTCVQKYCIDDSLNNAVFSVAFSPDGKTILTGMMEKTVRLWNTSTAQCIREFFGHKASIKDVAFTPDGKSVISGSSDGTMLLYDISDISSNVTRNKTVCSAASYRLDIKNRNLLFFVKSSVHFPVTISLYQVSGRKVFEKMIPEFSHGTISVPLDKPLQAGIYNYRVSSTLNRNERLASGTVVHY